MLPKLQARLLVVLNNKRDRKTYRLFHSEKWFRIGDIVWVWQFMWWLIERFHIEEGLNSKQILEDLWNGSRQVNKFMFIDVNTTVISELTLVIHKRFCCFGVLDKTRLTTYTLDPVVHPTFTFSILKLSFFLLHFLSFFLVSMQWCSISARRPKRNSFIDYIGPGIYALSY